MKDLTWKVFCMTGNIDTYLLLKEMEAEDESESFEDIEKQLEYDSPTT